MFVCTNICFPSQVKYLLQSQFVTCFVVMPLTAEMQTCIVAQVANLFLCPATVAAWSYVLATERVEGFFFFEVSIEGSLVTSEVSLTIIVSYFCLAGLVRRPHIPEAQWCSKPLHSCDHELCKTLSFLHYISLHCTCLTFILKANLGSGRISMSCF